MKTYSAFIKNGLICLIILIILDCHAQSPKGVTSNTVSSVTSPKSNTQNSAGEISAIKITDWVQAFGSLIAVLGVLVGFYTLYTDNKKQQTQINSLVILAQQSEIQSRHMSEQVNQMIESNMLQLQYISHFQQLVQISDHSAKQIHERELLDEKRRKFEIRPNFEIGFTSNDRETFRINIQNIGKPAKILSFEILTGHSMNLNQNSYLGKEMKTNETLDLKFSPAQYGLNTSNCNIKLKMNYSDIDDNQYYQIIESSGCSSIKISKPPELINS
jgi:hypothetical protein